MSLQPPGGPPPPPPGGPSSGSPYPPQGYPGPQQPWPQQQQWATGPPPAKRGNGWKWGLGALAVLVVVGVTAAVTISVTKGGEGNDGPTPTGETFGLASADDKGPANIIKEDPSCAAWRPVIDTLADEQRNGWDKRDRSIPATQWTTEQRSQYQEVADAMIRAADQTVALTKITPHRVMRELFEQFVTYSRAYAEEISSYTEADNLLVGVAGATSNAVTRICTAIEYGSAEARAPLIPPPSEPRDLAPLHDPSSPPQFLRTGDPTCSNWIDLLTTFDSDTAAWQALDPAITASEWSPEQRNTIDAVIPVMNRMAADMERLGFETTNPTLQDFAVLAAQYRRAYASALPSYSTADSYLGGVSAGITSAIADACRASKTSR